MLLAGFSFKVSCIIYPSFHLSARHSPKRSPPAARAKQMAWVPTQPGAHVRQRCLLYSGVCACVIVFARVVALPMRWNTVRAMLPLSGKDPRHLGGEIVRSYLICICDLIDAETMKQNADGIKLLHFKRFHEPQSEGIHRVPCVSFRIIRVCIMLHAGSHA